MKMFDDDIIIKEGDTIKLNLIKQHRLIHNNYEYYYIYAIENDKIITIKIKNIDIINGIITDINDNKYYMDNRESNKEYYVIVY